MTLRTNTVVYAFDRRTTDLASTTRHDFAANTIYIPETNSRTIRSAYVEVYAMDNMTVLTNISNWMIGIKLGATAFDDLTITSTIAPVSENLSVLFTRDVTSYFASNFGSGASQTCQVGVSFSGPTMNNISAKVVITYEYDDSGQDTRVKTVYIPLESKLGGLSTTLTEIGTNQVPDLDTFLPEASKTYREIFFEISLGESPGGTSDVQLGLALDAEAEALDGSHENAAATGRFYRTIWRRNDMTTNATHALKMRGTVADYLSTAGGTLVVTYEYSEDSSTAFMNSIHIPLTGDHGYVGGTTSADQSRAVEKFWIEEPATITLKQSGIYFSMSDISAGGIYVYMAAGSQTHRGYAPYTATGNSAGARHFVHRIDSGGAAGAGVTLARGENTLTVNWYRSNANEPGTGATLYAIINYTSGKHSAGSGAHAHTTFWSIQHTIAGARLIESSAMAPNISETNYAIIGAAIYAPCVLRYNTAGMGGYAIDAEVLGTEAEADGWRPVSDMAMIAPDRSAAISVFMCKATHQFKRNAGDPDPKRLGVEGSRKYRFSYGQSTAWGAGILVLTYHSITFTISGTISNYSGDGSGITVNIYRSDTKEIVATATTAAGGGYSATWYDNTSALFAEARQDATRVGRSDNTLAA